MLAVFTITHADKLTRSVCIYIAAIDDQSFLLVRRSINFASFKRYHHLVSAHKKKAIVSVIKFIM